LLALRTVWADLSDVYPNCNLGAEHCTSHDLVDRIDLCGHSAELIFAALTAAEEPSAEKSPVMSRAEESHYSDVVILVHKLFRFFFKVANFRKGNCRFPVTVFTAAIALDSREHESESEGDNTTDSMRSLYIRSFILVIDLVNISSLVFRANEHFYKEENRKGDCTKPSDSVLESNRVVLPAALEFLLSMQKSKYSSNRHSNSNADP
jgi:hypothetical protein